MQRPRLLDLAVRLIWAALALSVVSAAIATWRVSQTGDLESQNPAFLTLGFLLVLALFYFLTLRVQAGEGWARVLYVVLSVASLMKVVQNVTEQFHVSVVEGVVMVAGYAVLYSAAVLLVTPQVNQWFTRKQDGARRIA
jgi:hypothetical protein